MYMYIFFSLVMPLTNDNSFHGVEPIPFPDVPPEVLQHNNIDDQILELREWFKAWANQDHSVRDYRDYFKANLCYMEGAWVYGESVDMDGFESDRHFINASSWHDLQNKIRYISTHYNVLKIMPIDFIIHGPCQKINHSIWALT